MARTDISWAGHLDEVVGGGRPGFMLGAPDAQAAGIGDGQAVTFSAWKRASYEGLAELLATATPRPVTPQILERADLIAFELNGTAPAASGGWESCDWEFRDAQRSLVAHWQEGTVGGVFLGTPLPPDPHVVANGSITGAAYGAFFGIPASLITMGFTAVSPEEIVVSFLLLRVRGEIDVTGPAFRLTLRGVPRGPATPEATPDPDAVGVLRHGAALPPRPVKPKKPAARRVAELCAAVGVREAIVPALAAVWDRHASGQASRNDFEGDIYRAFDQLPQAQRAALGTAFAGFKAFRAGGTDDCLFSDELGALVPDRPLERKEFTAKFMDEGAGVAWQRFFENSLGQLGPGLAREWRPTISFDPDGGPVLAPAGPWPWITAIRPDGSNNLTEYGNGDSFRPRGELYVPQEHQFDKVCALRPEPGGTVRYHCDRVHPPGPPPGSPGTFPATGTCVGGRPYTFGNDCLLIPAQSAGGGVALRGFNFITPSVKVHLRAHGNAAAPVLIQECVVFGDRRTPLRNDQGQVIADSTVKDFVDVPIPAESPQQPGTPFAPGLYDIWVSVTDASNPAQPVERESNRLVLRVEPNPNVKFTLANVGGRCVEATWGSGNDDVWWNSFVGHIVPANMPITPQHTEMRLEKLEPKPFPRPEWDELSDGDEVRTGLILWGPDTFRRHGVVCVGLVGFEVDDEDAANEQLQGFWDAFAHALTSVALAAVGVTGTASSVIEKALKAGASTKVTMEAMAIGAAVVAALVLVSCAFWAAWAPADLIGLDILTLDALLASERTDPRKPLPRDTVRSFGGDTAVHEFPRPKSGPPAAGTCTWNQRNLYTSSEEESRYELDFTLDASLQVP